MENDPKASIEEKRQEAFSLAKQGNITGAIAIAKSILTLDPSSNLLDEVSELYLTLNPEMTSGREDSDSAESTRDDNKDAFQKTPLFSNLPQLELIEVINAANHITLPKGKEVFSTDDDGRSIFIITSGSADIVCKGQDNEDIICSTLKEGDFFGEFGYFGEKHRAASVQATEDLELLELTRTDLRLLIDSHHSIGNVLFDFYKERVLDKLLAVSRIFKHLTDADRKEVLELVHPEVFIDEMDIIREGDEGEEMYLIKMGTAQVWTTDESGKKKVLAELHEGDTFGELALILDTVRKASVTALTPIELVVFSRPVLQNILSKYPEIQTVFDNKVMEQLCGIEKLKEKLPLSAI